MEEWPEGFDLAALLAPITPEAPAGRDLREDNSPDGLYFRLRDARREASAAERAAEAPVDEGAPRLLEASIPPAERWRTLHELAIEALVEQTKDLEIAAWLTEALLRSGGLTGFTAGCRLMTGLAENFWDGLFPQPDDEGIATRVAPVASLNGVGRDGTLIQPLRRIALFERPRDRSPFYFYQYEQSEAAARISDPEARQERLDRGVLAFDAVESEAQTESAQTGLALLREQVGAAAEAWQSLGQHLDARAGADGPPTSRVRDVLEKIRDVVDRFIGRETGPPEERAATSAEEIEGAAAPAAAAPTPAPAPGTLASREDALRALAQIAEFFRRTEPLSPITYTLQEAVRRSRLTWPELLEEIVPDATSRSAILASLGIRPPPSE
jgi:type VI secretion system protein ImpA